MNRLYLSTQNVEAAEAITNDLLSKLSLPRERIQIIAENLQALKDKQLPVASIFTRTNILYLFERCSLVALLTGTLFSLLMIMVGPGGKPFITEMFFQLAFSIAAAGATIGIVAGFFMDNYHLKDYRSRLDRNECIIELKLSAEESDSVKNLIKQHTRVETLREDLDVCNRTISERIVKTA